MNRLHTSLATNWDQLECIRDYLKQFNILTQDSEQDTIEDAVKSHGPTGVLALVAGLVKTSGEKDCHSRLLEEIKADADYEHIKKLWLMSVVVESK